MSTQKIVIVGAGPAGTRAAQCLVRHGLTPLVISEAPDNGGQIYRRQPPGFTRSPQKLYGAEAHKAVSLHSTFDRLRSQIAYLPQTTVVNIVDRTLFLDTLEGVEEVTFDSLLLATGAMDRVIPMQGWTLPGVFTLGGAQVALKYQACAIGERVVFVGTGPLLYLVAYQYVKAGAQVAGVYDCVPFGRKVAALPSLLWSPRTAFLGMYYMARLKTLGVPVRQGITPVEIAGDGHVRAFKFRDDFGEHVVDCDAVGMGYGLKPESQLAELAGCSFRFDEIQRLWVVSHDGSGRVRPGLYVAGDCGAIGGADVAELQGELAALELLADLGMQASAARRRKLQGSLRRLARFRRGLENAFPFPQWLVHTVPKETIVCRCEAVKLGDMDDMLALLGPDDTNRLKAFCRTGMGRCQGRVCGSFLMEYLAVRSNKPIEAIRPLRAQAPIKPLAYAKAAARAEPGHALPAETPQ
ncbi:MAG: NAD(P)/FAD-dependent oxidoreductase [Proteobacteria bacterium]|nr:NAD(P)/FAD-dependent oxidoreductase [Pseudomonadota bacterium]